ncbi:MAG: hypothetical protein L0Y58_20520 [Verrucomicrobia subdivision 3 bacterium]|nr:hypothetical protein [Limisphaerales bacterium]
MYNAFGTHVSTSGGDLIESILRDADGIVTNSLVTTRPRNQTDTSVPVVRIEDDFQWRDGALDARVRTFAGGNLHGEFRVQRDPEGRTLVDEIKQAEGVELRTVNRYDGDTERVVLSEQFQNGARRTRRQPQPVVRQTNGAWLLPVVVTPAWGLSATQNFVLGDPLPRPVLTSVEDGSTIRVAEWFDGTPIAKTTELRDFQGRLRQRVRLAPGGEGRGRYDLLTRYNVSFWGAESLAEKQALMRGTDVPVYSDYDAERVYYDLSRPYQSPQLAVDPYRRNGVNATISTAAWSNIVRFINCVTNADSIVTESHDVRGLFFHTTLRRVTDRLGAVLEEQHGRLPSSLPSADVFARATPSSTYQFEYAPGYLGEQSTAAGRVLSFTTNNPGDLSVRVNADGRRDVITSISVRDEQGVRRRFHSPRWLETNAFLPGRANVWTEWTATEFDRSGQELFRAEHIYDSRGRLSLSKTIKQNGSGDPAIKLVYDVGLPSETELREQRVTIGSNALTLTFAGTNDCSNADFIYWYGIGDAATPIFWTINDAAGRRVRLTNGEPDLRAGVIAIWPARSGHTLWLPDAVAPEQAAAVHAPAHLNDQRALVAVSVQELSLAGLDIRRLQSVRGDLHAATNGVLQLSPVFQLRRDAPPVRLSDDHPLAYEVIPHSSGLTTFIAAEQDRLEGEIHGAERMTSVTEFNDVPVMVTHTVRGKSHVFFVDHTAESLRPLYAIWPREGRFLEHYKTARRNHAEVYAIVQGFELPRAEVFDPRRLADEIYPSLVAYGRDYEVTFRPGKARGWLSESWASVQGRVMANTFRFGGENFFDWIGLTNLGSSFLPQYQFAELHNAQNQAREIRRLPMLAEALLASREVPWSRANQTTPPAISNGWRQMGFVLSRLRLNYPTGLIPTAPETAVERYVNTETEAKLIILATKIGELAMARDILDFYWQKSQGGQTPLHSSYDARSGTAMSVDLTYQRPVYARRTATAQIAIIEAALTLGLETADAQWITLGRNLLEVLMAQFRPPRSRDGQPRGLTELPFLPLRNAYGVALWPEAHVYSLESNARACLLLKRLDNISENFVDRAWRFVIAETLREQEAWLRSMVFADLERSGVPPKGVFNVQDISQQTSAIAPERWTSAADWLALIETAHELGAPRERMHQYLENLARVHGVYVNGIWGLDWTVPTLRPDAISTDLTAAFARVAGLIGHTNAAFFSRTQLGRMQQGNVFPAVFTTIAPARALQSGQGFAIYPAETRLRWPPSYVPFKDLRLMGAPAWSASTNRPVQTIPVAQVWPRQRTDMTVFILITAGVYMAILGSAIFWWIFRAFRGGDSVFPDPLVPDGVMQLAEERWAKRVLGARPAPGAENSRYSNAPVEGNFLMQLRAIYKLIIEWRRQENGWDENDRRIVEDASDDWLNGLDEYACVVGLYMRWVIKAGAKDGFDKEDVLAENEDSNHIWSRLVMFFSEYYWGVLTLLRNYNALVIKEDKANLYAEISQLLSSMALRQRSEPFDARVLFNFPEDRSAMDLLVVQQPGRTLDQVLIETSKRLRIPYLHLVRIVERYKEFKRREQPYPVHPYVIEAAKVLPHFLLMGLGALVWYNQSIGDSPIVPYLWSVLTRLALSPLSLLWAFPLFASMVLGAASHFVRIYRFDAPMLVREKTEMILDATLTSLFGKRHSVMPKAKQGRWWNPDLYERAGWILRAIGYLGLGITLLRIETPSFATFLIVKGILAMLAFTEVIAIIAPLASTALSKFLQDYVSNHPACGKTIRFINRLNITATRPASPIWLSFKYHTQPSVPTGDFWGMLQAIVFYFVLGAVFFFAGGYLCQQIFSLWFMDTYLNAANWKLFFGAMLFWNTMYLLRYGLFLAFTGIASALVTFPIKTTFGLLAGTYLLLTFFSSPLGIDPSAYPITTYSLMVLGLVLMVFEGPILRWLNNLDFITRRRRKRQERQRAALDGIKTLKSGTLGIVYMSGDDLSYQKLTPDLLMERWSILRDRLGSEVVQVLVGALSKPEDATLRQWFDELYAAEKKADVTLWHPSQLVVLTQPAGEDSAPALPPELALHIPVESTSQRDRLLAAWHVRRWLVSMMSTAGHSQDTAINLVDIALRLTRDGLAENTAFYLVQNKYDNNDNNRPSQTPYDRGELGHRNKLARLLMSLAPGCRAYSLQNWTPFGFKAGGLTGMDLAHEEALKLTTMLVLDRNATVHDIDGLMTDLTTALSDPDVVIIIPGRGTTNTLTSVGQGSQMVEEGHRSFLKGLMGLLGGRAAEGVGTGWGNLLAAYYGRVQRALTDAHSPKMPLTSRMRRGSSFAVRAEGMIGFAPHAVGISEDTWAVSQTAHNAIALGRRVKFLVSKAMWHKIRETWSHSEWIASFPRWSGGYLQMMHDPIMQRVNDFGASSVFAKEIRANSGRNFLSAPFALFNILFMPLAIMLDITPFIQILIVLWNFGFVMNQILTVHGLNTYLESSGFYRTSAILGAAVASLAAWLTSALQPFAPGLITAGFLLGGFFVGVSRWLYTRLRDMLLFGPQLVLHALGQVVRQTLEFTVSGASPQDARGVNMAFRAWAGPREDRPWEGYPNFMNLKTVVWLVGLLSVILNLFALANLDMLNVLLLLPSLLFSASTLLGPFLLRPRVGSPIGKWVLIPKILGWTVAALFYAIVSMLAAREQWLRWIGLAIFVAVFALLLRVGLRFAGYRSRWHRLREKLCQLLSPGLPENTNLRGLADALMQKASDEAQLHATLDRANVPAESRGAIFELLARRVAPMLRSAGRHPQAPRPLPLRFVSEFGRSLALALFILVWFFVVPVPGVLVFTAGAYRFSLNLGAVLQVLAWVIGLIILAAWIGRFVQWLDREGLGTRSLRARFVSIFDRLVGRDSASAKLTPEQFSQAGALLTDAQTYLDQRSLAYARQTFSRIEEILK